MHENAWHAHIANNMFKINTMGYNANKNPTQTTQ